jgi:hypothetical protein
MKHKVLFAMHMPPPVHGAAMMGRYIHDSKAINDAFDCHYINLTMAQGMDDIGKLRLGKLEKFVCLLFLICKSILVIRPDLVYVTPNACGTAFYKDFFIVELSKMMGCKVIIHYHNKGVASRQNHCLDNMLYKCFFHHVKVILLAESLYPDVRKYVSHDDIYICANGIPA